MAETISEYALIDLADMKKYLRIGSEDTIYDEILVILINSMSGVIEKYIGRNILQREYEEVYSGTGSASITLRQYPVASIESVWMDRQCQFGDETLLDPSTYFCYKDYGVLYRVGGVFDNGLNNVKVKYTAGYETVPYELKYVVTVLVKTYFDRWKKGSEDIQNITWQSQGMSYITGETFPLVIREVLNKYRAWGRNG